MKQPAPTNWITQALEITENVTNIIEKALPSEQERLLRLEINKVAKIARAKFRAEKHKLNQTMLIIKRMRKGLCVARKEGLDLTKLKANLQAVLESIGV